MSETINLLSDEFKVACAVYEITEIDKKKAFYSVLVERLKDYLTESTILRCLFFLNSWGIIDYYYGETTKDRAGRLCKISEDDKEEITKLYETYWKPSIQSYNLRKDAVEHIRESRNAEADKDIEIVFGSQDSDTKRRDI